MRIARLVRGRAPIRSMCDIPRLEPMFSFRYTRNVLMPDGTRREEEVSDYAYRAYRRLKGDSAPLPEYFVDSQTLAPEDHLVMQAAVQKHIDSSISKTINVAADIPFDTSRVSIPVPMRSAAKAAQPTGRTT